MSTESRRLRRIKWWNLQQKRKKLEAETGTHLVKGLKSHPKSRPKVKESTSTRGFRSHVKAGILSGSDDSQSTPHLTSAAAVDSPFDDSSSDESDTTGCKSEISAIEMHKSTSHDLDTKNSSNDEITTTNDTVSSTQNARDKRRYILFLGNLSPASTHEDILAHFKKRGVPIKELRLLTHKDTGKSRGCAFAEFKNDKTLKNALKFHRSKLNGKTINIEVTCGGGGKGETRKEKITTKNQRQRVSKARKSKF